MEKKNVAFSLAKIKTMRKTFILFVVAALTFASSCRSKSILENSGYPKINNPVKYYSNKLINDSSFQNFIITTSKKSLYQAKLISKSKLNKIQTIDSLQVFDASAEMLTSLYFFDKNYPDFMQLPTSIQDQIMYAIRDSLSSVTYRSNYPNNPLILYELATMPLLVDDGELAVVDRFAFVNITSTEFWQCTMTVGIAALNDFSGILQNLKWLISNGANSWKAVFDLAFDILKNDVPWFKVATLALSYASCLYFAGLS